MNEIAWDFISKLGLLIIGWFLTQRVVHNYQKNKDVREVRERILKHSMDTTLKYIELIRYWNEWVDFITPDDSDETENDRENAIEDETEFNEYDLLNKIETAFIELQYNLTLLVGRINVYFKFPPNALEFVTRIDNKIKNLAGTMEKFQETGEAPKDLRKESMILAKFLGEFIPIVLNAKPK